MIPNQTQIEFLRSLSLVAQAAFDNSRAHGFWPLGSPRNKGEMIALMHSELSEMLEAVRKPHVDEHCSEFSSEEIEAADVLIRLMDYCHGHNLRLADATLVKMAFNAMGRSSEMKIILSWRWVANKEVFEVTFQDGTMAEVAVEDLLGNVKCHLIAINRSLRNWTYFLK